MSPQSHNFFSGLTAIWFDVLVLGWIVFGFWRGKKNGFSGEICSAFTWCLMVCASAALYTILGGFFGQAGCFTTLWAYRLGYLVPCVMIWLFMARPSASINEILSKMDFAGRAENVWGVVCGGFRYAFIFIILFSFFNAAQPTDADIQDMEKTVSSISSKAFNPMKMQRDIFLNSMTGRALNQYVWFAIINPHPEAITWSEVGTLKAKKQNLIDDITGSTNKP